MPTTTTIAAATEHATRGWGGPIALLVAVAAFIVIGYTAERLRPAPETDEIDDPSPTPPRGRGVSRDPQVSAVSGEGDTAADTDPDTDEDEPWYGGIVQIGNQRVRLDGARYRALQQVLRTGSTRTADEDDLDDADDELADDDDGEEAVDLDGDGPETMEQAIARMDADGEQYSDIVRHVMGEYDVSESTAKRRIKAVREHLASA